MVPLYVIPYSGWSGVLPQLSTLRSYAVEVIIMDFLYLKSPLEATITLPPPFSIISFTGSARTISASFSSPACIPFSYMSVYVESFSPSMPSFRTSVSPIAKFGFFLISVLCCLGSGLYGVLWPKLYALIFKDVSDHLAKRVYNVHSTSVNKHNCKSPFYFDGHTVFQFFAASRLCFVRWLQIVSRLCQCLCNRFAPDGNLLVDSPV